MKKNCDTSRGRCAAYTVLFLCVGKGGRHGSSAGIAAVQFFGAKFQKFFGCVSGIRFAVSFGVRLRTAGVRGQRTKRRLSSLARQTASQSPDQTAQSETRCLPAFKTRRQTPQTVVCAVRFCSSVCQARHKSRRKCPIAREHPWCTVEPQKDRNHRRCR